MDIDKLTEQWVDYFNRHYIPYISEAREPRNRMKQFFLYSYKLLRRFGDEWKGYLEDYNQLFLCDPTNDWYSKRHVIGDTPEQISLNVLEWTNTFEIVGIVGYPANKSAKEDMLKYAGINLGLIKKNPDGKFYDLMISSLIMNIPSSRKLYSDLLKEMIIKNLEKDNYSIHSLVAYLNALKYIENSGDLSKDITKRILTWIDKPEGHARLNILMVSRIITNLDMSIFGDKKTEVLSKLTKLYFEYLNSIPRLEDWVNVPLNLEAAYLLTNDENKRKIKYIISKKISPSKLVKLKELFNFLTEERFDELDVDVEKIKEKCISHPTKEQCLKCMSEKQGTCWMRILAKLLKVAPGFHEPFEIGDTVIYTLEQGIYFVIKAEDITKQTGEGDRLYRQTTLLFNQVHALVFYLNPKNTASAVIENIKKSAGSSSNNPKFVIIDKKYISQIYKEYKEKYD